MTRIHELKKKIRSCTDKIKRREEHRRELVIGINGLRIDLELATRELRAEKALK